MNAVVAVYLCSKLQKYSPNEAQKVWERPISRKVTNKFNPAQALELLKLGSPTLDTIDSEGKQKLLEDYLEVNNSFLSAWINMHYQQFRTSRRLEHKTCCILLPVLNSDKSCQGYFTNVAKLGFEHWIERTN